MKPINWGFCDCCDREGHISRCWAYGIETFACDECRGIDPSDYDEGDEELRYYTETGEQP